ncbi:MAG: hypothetical protein QNJ03_06620 [Dinoroseobacter sp.]|nr:hypothetical protein [Dinoroseobacter sp.]
MMDFPLNRTGKAFLVLFALCIPLFLPIGELIITLLFWSVIGMPIAVALLAAPLIVFCAGLGWATGALAKSFGMPEIKAVCLAILTGIAPLTLPVLLLNPKIEGQLARILEDDVLWPADLPNAETPALIRQRTGITERDDLYCDALCTELLVYDRVPGLILAQAPAHLDISDTMIATRFQLRNSSACTDLRDATRGRSQDPEDLRHAFRFCIEATPVTLAAADLALVDNMKSEETPDAGLVSAEQPGISGVHRRSVLQRTASGWRTLGQQSWVSYRTFVRLPLGVDLQASGDGSFTVFPRFPTVKQAHRPSEPQRDWFRQMLGPSPA